MTDVNCLGVKVKKLQLAEFFVWLKETIEKNANPCASFFIVNAHTLNLAWTNPDFRKILSDASLVLNDGIGLDICSKLQGNSFCYNFNGTDLFPTIFDKYQSNNANLTIYLYGAKPGVADTAALAISKKWPTVKIVGTSNGFTKNNAEIIASINKTKPDILLVALGNPVQELWINANKSQLNCKIAVGVGALFDFLSGNVTRAPQWVRTVHFEWFYRLIIEPKRMFLRYVIGIPLFFIRLAKHSLTAKEN